MQVLALKIIKNKATMISRNSFLMRAHKKNQRIVQGERDCAKHCI